MSGHGTRRPRRKDGRFGVTISEPMDVLTNRMLKLVACCENGTMTGDGKTRGIGSAQGINYPVSHTGYQLIK